MWFLPTHERPDRLKVVLDACVATGMTTPGCVIVNGSDGAAAYDGIELPANWRLVKRPIDEPVAEAYRWVYSTYPALDWYGFLTDDLVPMTDGWDIKLVQQAAHNRIVSSNDGWQAPKRMHGAFVVGGDLFRAMGGVAPPGFQHQFLDDVLENIGRDLGVWETDMSVLVEHRHPLKSGGQMDESYKRNFARQEADARRFEAWTRFEKNEIYKKLTPFAKTGAVRSVDVSGKLLTIATPCYGGQINHVYVQALAQTIPLLLGHNVGFNVITVPKESLIQRARNYCVDLFLKGEGTHLLFIDADMGWEPHAILQMLAAEKDVIAAAGVRKEEPVSFCWNAEAGPLHRCPQTGVIRVKQVGTGFMMIRREALEKMVREMPELRYYDIQAKGYFHALFEVTRRGGYQWSEDYTFCDRWRELGGEVWVNPMIALQHVGDKVYTGKLFDALTKTPVPEAKPEPAAEVVPLVAAGAGD